jgi:hypothetical protein
VQLYDRPAGQRSEAELHDLFRAVWLKLKDKYVEEIFPTVEQQRSFGQAGLKLLSNYYKVRGACLPVMLLTVSGSAHVT